MANLVKNSVGANVDVYTLVTEKFIEALKGGFIPWRRPWSGSGSGARSYESGESYSFLNQCLILAQAQELNRGIEDESERAERIKKISGGRFITFTALQKIDGARIVRGSKSYIVTFYKPFQPKDENGNPAVIIDDDGTERPKLIPILRYYRVFSEFDCTGLPAEVPSEVKVLDPIAEAEKVINNYISRANGGPAFFSEPNNRAYYSPASDEVHVPALAQYKLTAEYYSTTFHELTHSTGHSSRCNRDGITRAAVHFGDKDYSREELVAEMGSAMCLQRLQIDSAAAFKNSVAYVQSWLRALQNDNKMVIWAAARAEKAVKWIFGERDGVQPSPAPETKPESTPAPQPQPQPQPAQPEQVIDITGADEVKDKIIRLHVTILKSEKIGGVISEVVQEEFCYLKGSKLTKDINEADKVTATFAETEREYITETTRAGIQSRLDAKYPGKYTVDIQYSAI